MIAKLTIICLAVSVLAAADNEVHYHYHMDGETSPKLAHEGYKACYAGAYAKHGGCMTLAIFSAAKRAACRATLASRLAECRLNNPATESRRLSSAPQAKRALSAQHKGLKACVAGAYTRHGGCMTLAIFSADKRAACRATLAGRIALCKAQNPAQASSRLLTGNKRSHNGFRKTLCDWNSGIKFGVCKMRASIGGTDAEKAEKKANCDKENELRKSECAAKHSLAIMKKRAMTKEQHKLFCETRAKHSWFWCDFWAKLRGGDHKAERIADCEAKFNASQAICKAEANPNTTSTVVTEVHTSA